MAEVTLIGATVAAVVAKVEPGEPGNDPIERLSFDAAAALPPRPWIPERFNGVTLGDYHPRSQSQALALRAVRTFGERIHEEKPVMLALIGETGTGKSHLLYALALELHAAGVRTCTSPWYRLADQLRYGGPAPFNPGKRLESHELREILMSERVLMIDEVRPTAGTAFDDTELAKIICNAWDRQQWILITTNVSPLTEVVGAPLASRFTQLVITGPDGRGAGSGT
ncbi:MAG: hypothetical protein ACSLFE_03745 [Gemmatimonadaceae bacterium]